MPSVNYFCALFFTLTWIKSNVSDRNRPQPMDILQYKSALYKNNQSVSYLSVQQSGAETQSYRSPTRPYFTEPNEAAISLPPEENWFSNARAVTLIYDLQKVLLAWLLSDQALVRLERIRFYQKEKKMLLQLVDLTVVPGKSFWTRHSFVMNFPRQILKRGNFPGQFLNQ